MGDKVEDLPFGPTSWNRLTAKEAIEMVKRGEPIPVEEGDRMRVDEHIKFIEWLIEKRKMASLKPPIESIKEMLARGVISEGDTVAEAQRKIDRFLFGLPGGG